MLKQITFIILPVLLLTKLPAQNLEALRAEVAAANPELIALEKEYQAALERAPQVSQLPDPELGISVFPLPVETRLGPQRLRIGATQMFPWFGTLKQQQVVEDTKAQALYERIALRRQALFFALDQAFLELYQLQDKGRILQKQLRLLESLESLALAKTSSGQASAADVLQVQIRTEAVKQEILILEQTQAAPIATINQLRHQPPTYPLAITDTLAFTELPFVKETIQTYIRETHPHLRIHGLEQEVAKQIIQLNELQQKPSFGLGADYINVAPRENATINNNGRDILLLRASVKVPLYRKQYAAREREQSLRIQALQSQHAASVDELAAAVEKAFTRHATARLELDLYQRQENLTQSLIRMLESSYSTGDTRLDELLRYEQDLINYQLKKLEAIISSHLAVREIQQLIF